MTITVGLVQLAMAIFRIGIISVLLPKHLISGKKLLLLHFDRQRASFKIYFRIHMWCSISCNDITSPSSIGPIKRIRTTNRRSGIFFCNLDQYAKKSSKCCRTLRAVFSLANHLDRSDWLKNTLENFDKLSYQ